jgi:hypothetical protein
MKLTLKRILKEELARSKEEIPNYMETVLKVLNSNFEQLGIALSNRLSFEDNFSCTMVTREFTHAVELEINPFAGKTGNLRVTGVIPLSGDDLGIDKFGWAHKSTGNIGVTISFVGGSGTTTADCKIAVLLG